MTAKIVIPLIVTVIAATWFVIAITSRKINPGTSKLALVGGVLMILVGILIGFVAILEIPVTAAIAIPIFVAILFEFGFTIAYVGRIASGRVSQRAFMTGVLVIIAGILIGLVLMFQPWTLTVFNLGFDFVLISLLMFIIWSHVTPRLQEQK